MVEYRYYRMVDNSEGWLKPNSGRLKNSGDYVGENGFGHEDWNFTKDVWDDGRCHLYLKSLPAKSDINSVFHIALGARTPYGHVIVGFCENTKFQKSTLDPTIWTKRAKHLEWLEKNKSLGGELVGLSLQEKAYKLEHGPEVYLVSVAPNDLTILEIPIKAPENVVGSKYNRYGLIRLSHSQFKELKKIGAENSTPDSDPDPNDGFPEGRLVQKMHRGRERSSELVSKAKSNFILKNKSLFCEACRWRPEKQFSNSNLINKVIEAHHDIPLHHDEHTGKTKIEDLKMLCPNCHRAIHRLRPWLKVSDFKKKIFE